MADMYRIPIVATRELKVPSAFAQRYGRWFGIPTYSFCILKGTPGARYRFRWLPHSARYRLRFMLGRLPTLTRIAVPDLVEKDLVGVSAWMQQRG
jgi:hypothetical protein